SSPSLSSLFPYTTLFRSCFELLYRNVQKIFNAINQRGSGIHHIIYQNNRPVFVICFLKIGSYFLQRILFVDFHTSERYFQIRYRSEEHTSELQSRENLVC